MRAQARVLFVGAAAAWLFGVTPAAAQDTASSFAGLSGAVDAGDRVAITAVDGEKLRGDVIAATDDALTIRTVNSWGDEERRTFAPQGVTLVRRADRLWNGALIGLGAGAVGAEIFVRQNCGPRGYDEECAAIAGPVGWLTMPPAGAAIGALVDKLIGNEVLYRRDGGRASVALLPSIGRSTRSLSMTITF
jgi:hypothetical protein